MSDHSFREEAESCRREAATYAGRPEANFLMRIASAFEELTSEGSDRSNCEGGTAG